MDNMLKEVQPMKVSAKTKLSKINPTGNGVMVAIKSWPSQNMSGIIVPDSYVAIRGEKYVTEVVKVGPDVDMVKPGDAVICSIFSGHHLATAEKHAKVIRETDILVFKDKEGIMTFKPESFKPGKGYILIKIPEKVDMTTESGLFIPAATIGSDHQKQDVATVTAEVLAIGPESDLARPFTEVQIGAKVIVDSYAGLDIPQADASDGNIYRIMYMWDVIATIEE